MKDFYNLFDEPWISVLNKDLTYSSYGIKELLLKAHEIVELSEATPLTKYGIYRLLIALVMDAFDINDQDTLEELLVDKRFSEEVIDKYYEEQRSNFYLFSETRPFFQNPHIRDTELKKQKSVSSLFPFNPSGNNTILFNHSLEEEHKISPKYCAKALCTLSAFIPIGGRGYTASINGRPPWYILLKGNNLYEILLLNSCSTSIPENDSKAPVLWKLPSVIQDEPISQTSTLQGLTWLPRYVYLFPDEGGKCTYSGETSDILVSNIAFEQGWSFKGKWVDPHASYITSNKGRFPLSLRLGKKIWRDIGPLLLKNEPGSSIKFTNPIVVRQFYSLQYNEILPDDYLMIVEAYGIRTEKAKYLEWFEETLSLPLKILRDSFLKEQIQPAIDLANKVEYLLNITINDVATKNKRKLNVNSLKRQALDKYWGRLEPLFKKEFLLKLQRQDINNFNESGQLQLEWKHTLRGIGREILEECLGEISTNPQFLRNQVESMDNFNRKIYYMLFKKKESKIKTKKS